MIARALVLVTCVACGADGAGAPPGSAASVAAPPSARVSADVASASASVALPPPAVTAPDDARRARLEADVAKVAVVRPPGSPGHEAVKRHVVGELERAGFEPELSRFSAGGGGQNVIATRAGTKHPDEIVVLSAHYDHIAGCAGADDNASGVAVILEAARAMIKPGDRTLVIASWDREEDGLVGSSAWAVAARQRGARIALAISLDGVGYADHRDGSQTLPDGAAAVLPDVAKRLAANHARGDFVAALGDSGAAGSLAFFERAGAAIGQPAFGVELAGLSRLMLLDAARSDHASFWAVGYPAVLITDTANFRNPRYHCNGGPDDKGTLDYDMLARVASLVIATTEDALRGGAP